MNVRNPLSFRHVALAAASSLFLLAGCASTPPAGSPAPSAQKVAARTPATASKTDNGFKPPNGYTTKVVRGQTVYCQSIAVVGTRLPQQYCFSQDQLEELERRNQSVQQELTKSQRTCAGGSHCGG